jgi:hypothetical protein
MHLGACIENADDRYRIMCKRYGIGSRVSGFTYYSSHIVKILSLTGQEKVIIF